MELSMKIDLKISVRCIFILLLHTIYRTLHLLTTFHVTDDNLNKKKKNSVNTSVHKYCDIAGYNFFVKSLLCLVSIRL